jgi:hypothetical protein
MVNLLSTSLVMTSNPLPYGELAFSNLGDDLNNLGDDLQPLT